MVNTAKDEVRFRDWTEGVFDVRCSELVVFDHELSDGAFRTYMVLIRYFQRGVGFIPTVEEMAELRKRTVDEIAAHIEELIARGLIIEESEDTIRVASMRDVYTKEDVPTVFPE